MQLWQKLNFDWTTGIISAAILLTFGQLVQVSTLFSAPPAVGLSLASIIVVLFFTSLTNEQRWSPASTIFAITIMLVSSVVLTGIASQFGEVGIVTAWTGLALAFGFASVLGIGSASPPLLLGGDTSVIEESTDLENQLLATSDETELVDETVVQSWTRVQTRIGEERLEGTIQVAFIKDQRIFNLHLPIYPAFQKIPEVWCETESGDCLAEVDTKQTYGSRIRVRRTGSDLPAQEVHLEVVMTTSKQNLADAA